MHPRRQVLPCSRSQRCKVILLCIALAAWLCPASLFLAQPAASARAPASALQGGWQAYPRVELITRTYADRYFALLHILLPSTLLFWLNWRRLAMVYHGNLLDSKVQTPQLTFAEEGCSPLRTFCTSSPACQCRRCR